MNEGFLKRYFCIIKNAPKHSRRTLIYEDLVDSRFTFEF